MALDLETRKNNWQIEIEVGKGPDKYQKRGRMAGNSATHRVYRTRIEDDDEPCDVASPSFGLLNAIDRERSRMQLRIHFNLAYEL